MALSLLNNSLFGDGGGTTAAPATPTYTAYAQPQTPPPPASTGSPFALRAGGTSGSLGSIIPNYQQAAGNPYGLQDYGTDNNVSIGGKQYSLRQDTQGDGSYTLSDISNNDVGGYRYDSKGNFQNWVPYNNQGNNDWVVPLVAALTMGASGALAGGGSEAVGGSTAGGTGGGFMMGGGAEGYGGLSAADAATMGGGNSILGGSALETAGAGAGGLASSVGGSGASGSASSGLTTGNPIVDKALQAGGSSLLSSGLSSAINGGKSGGSAGGVGGILSGAYDYYAQNKAANNMLDYMKTQQGKIDSIYNNPNSPVAKTMWDQMSAADARAGRNSQYGPRTTDFLGKFGGDYARYTAALTQGLAGNYQNAFNQQASAGTGLAAGVGQAVNSGVSAGLNSIIQNGSSYIPTGTTGAYTAGGQTYNNPSAYGGSNIPYEEDTNIYNPTIY